MDSAGERELRLRIAAIEEECQMLKKMLESLCSENSIQQSTKTLMADVLSGICDREERVLVAGGLLWHGFANASESETSCEIRYFEI